MPSEALPASRGVKPVEAVSPAGPSIRSRAVDGVGDPWGHAPKGSLGCRWGGDEREGAAPGGGAQLVSGDPPLSQHQRLAAFPGWGFRSRFHFGL